MLDSTKGSKPKSNRIKFEMSDNITLVVENEYCKIYNDKRSGKTFKVINDEIVPLELRELNLWKNRQKNPRNFKVETIKDENGNVFDFVISRISADASNAAPAQKPTAPAPNVRVPNAPAQNAQPPQAPKAPVQNVPAPQAPKAAVPPKAPAAPSAPANVRVQQPRREQAARPQQASVTTTVTDQKPSRIKFEMTPTTELVLKNEYFELYKDARSGKTFKVLGGEVAPIELRELNMWKNREKTPSNFSVEIVKGADGTVYDYKISRAAASPANENNAPKQPESAPAVNGTPVIAKKEDTQAKPAAVSAPKPTPPAQKPASPRINPNADKAADQPQRRAAKTNIPSVTNSVGTAPTDRVKFEQTPTTEVVVENEFCKIYKDTRSGKTFKVINDMIAPIELRELNMWKNRVKNPSGFTVEIMKDSSGTPFDYIISRINEDGTLTKAPAVAPVAPYVPPENEYVPTTSTLSAAETKPKKDEPVKPAQVFPVGKPSGALPVKDSKEKGPDVIDRIKFEETPSMSVVVENEFFKIYNDSRRGKTFKVIDGKIAPIELRELNMWKNRQRKPKNFAIEVIKTPSGEVYDYKITRTEKSTTAAVESTSTKTNMPPVSDTPNSNVAAKKRRPNANRVSKCAICGKEFNESELLLFDNRNFCSPCVEQLIKEKIEVKPVDPIQKVIDDVVAADELYCTYSTVTNYPYLDEEFCVNVCTVKRAAESIAEDTAVQTIDDKGMFFDDLKRFGLKKIIVNNDPSHVFDPKDFDEHVKTEGVIAPKLYFKILDFMQKKDDELREKIAVSFLDSTVYTYALNDDITEITEENIDDFKPLTITDGYANFCPVFTDFTEARSVGMPFRGLYEISARLLTKYNITHFIINPSSLGFIMNKSILGLVEAPIVEEITAAAEPTEKTVDNKAADTDAAAESVEINTAAQNAEEIISEQEAPLVQDQFITEEDTQSFNAFENAAVSDPVDGFMEEVQNEIAQEPQQFVPDMNVPSDETVFAQNSQVADQFLTPAQTSAQAADQFLTSTQTSTPVADQFFAQPKAPIAEQFAAAPSLTQAPVADQFFAQPKTAAAPIAQPAPQPVLEKPAEPTPEPEQAAAPKAPKEKSNQDIVIKANNPDGTKKAIKVSMPIFIPDDPNEDLEVNTSVSSSLQNAIKKSQAMMNDDVFGKKPFNEALGKPVEEKPADNAPKKDFSFSDIMNDLASDNESTKFDLSSLMMSHAEEQPAAPVKPKLTIQTQATETKMIARELEVEPDIRVAQILRDKLNDGYRNLARLISEAEVMYAEYDANTKHILIDGNNKGHIFSEKIYADKSVENFAKNGIKVYIKEYKNEDLFSMLYEYKRHGIQDLVLDETANWVIVSADTIIDMLDVNEKKFVPIPIANPELMFAMTTLFQKLQSKNDNPKRKQEIASLEKMMIREFTSARYILPLVAYDENNIRPISIDGKNGVKRILVFSDAFEMKRFFSDKIGIVRDYEIITYKELIKKFTVMPNTVVVLNEGPLRFEFNDHNCDHINKVIMGK